MKRNKKRHKATNMKNKTKKQERVDGMVARVKAARETIVDGLNGVHLPCEAIARTALEGALNNRTGQLLAKAPTFHKRPLGSLLHRLVRWNQSVGNLHGLFSVKWDCETLAKFDDKATHGPMANDKRMIGELTGEQLFDELTSMAMLLCNGSQAANNWKRALGW